MHERKLPEPSLMQLAIPRGWAVGDNKFYDIEPIRDPDTGNDFISNALWGFTEDTIWLFEWYYAKDNEGNRQLIIPSKNHYTIDVRWQPDSLISGQYYAALYWDGESRIEVENLASKNRFTIRTRIEEWMNDITTNYAAAHSRFI